MAKNKASDDLQFEPDLGGYEKAFEESFTRENEKFEEIKRQKLIISMYGSVNSGKSTTINALTGRKLADVKAVAGWTKEIRLYEFSRNVYITDTPGLDDVNEENSARAQEFVEKDTDIILFFFNASVGASKSTVDAYKELQKLGKPIIPVLNKIDSLTFDEREEVAEDIKNRTGARVVSISARDNSGIDVLNRKIVEMLESVGKELLYLKISKYKDEQVDIWIMGAATTAAGLGAIPVPGADILPLTTLQVGLALKIAHVYECEVTKKDVMQLVAATVTGGLGRQVYRWGIQGLKGLGWLGGPIGGGAVMALAASVAASVTYGFGQTCKAYYKSGMAFDLDEAGEMFKKYAAVALSTLRLDEGLAAALRALLSLKNKS